MQISKIVENWDKYLDDFYQKTIYFTEKYIKSHATSEDIPLCYVYMKNEDKLIFPLLKRAYIEIAHFLILKLSGYGGCLSTTDDSGVFLDSLRSFLCELKKESIIAGFVRFDPSLNQNYQKISAKLCLIEKL